MEKNSHPPSDQELPDDKSNKESLSSTAVDPEPETEPDNNAPTTSMAAAHAILDWDSADDVGNPKNWGVKKKIFHTAIPALYGFSVYLHPFHCIFVSSAS